MGMCQEQAGADRVLGVPGWLTWTLQDLSAALPCSHSTSQLLPAGTMLGTELHNTHRATLAQQRSLQLQWPQVESFLFG